MTTRRLACFSPCGLTIPPSKKTKKKDKIDKKCMKIHKDKSTKRQKDILRQQEIQKYKIVMEDDIA